MADIGLRQDEAFLRRAFHKTCCPASCPYSARTSAYWRTVSSSDSVSALTDCPPLTFVCRCTSCCASSAPFWSPARHTGLRAIGRRQTEQSGKLYNTAVWSCVAAGIAVTAAGLALCAPISALLCPDETVRPLVMEYNLVTLIARCPRYSSTPPSGSCAWTGGRGSWCG
ncbi:MAG: hypothetical protein ACLUEK_00175 [Oscillospiraceae bacterium]